MIRPNGTIFDRYRFWKQAKYETYDYERNGLLKHIMSSKIVNTNNIILKYILDFFEGSMIFLMKYIDDLKNFKNIRYKNR